MAKKLIPDDVWKVVSPLLPVEPPRPRGGRSRVDSRAALTGILFVLKSGIPWELLPHEMGCGSGMTCWRRLREWQKAGVWAKIASILSQGLPGGNRIEWSRAERERNAPASRRALARSSLGDATNGAWNGATGSAELPRAGIRNGVSKEGKNPVSVK